MKCGDRKQPLEEPLPAAHVRIELAGEVERECGLRVHLMVLLSDWCLVTLYEGGTRYDVRSGSGASRTSFVTWSRPNEHPSHVRR